MIKRINALNAGQRTDIRTEIANSRARKTAHHRGEKVAKTAIRRFFLSLVLAASLLISPWVATAESAAGGMAKEAGVGAGSAIASLVYAPIKLAYAAGGLVVGGLAWAFSGGDSSVASIILTPSLLGDYVITPQQLAGRQEIEFVGRKPEYRSDSDWSEAPSEGEVAATEGKDW